MSQKFVLFIKAKYTVQKATNLLQQNCLGILLTDCPNTQTTSNAFEIP